MSDTLPADIGSLEWNSSGDSLFQPTLLLFLGTHNIKSRIGVSTYHTLIVYLDRVEQQKILSYILIQFNHSQLTPYLFVR